MLKAFQNTKLKASGSFQKNFDKPTKPIVEIYERLIGGKIKRSGRASLVCCPIHGEEHPSCALYNDNNTYFCFSCGISGDYIDFVMKIKNIDFKTALEVIKKI